MLDIEERETQWLREVCRMSNIKIKTGMGGSRNGKGRREGTETLKTLSSKRRRADGRRDIRQQCAQ